MKSSKKKLSPDDAELRKSVKPVISGAKGAIGTPGKKGLRYNPYGKGATATPENMAPGKP